MPNTKFDQFAKDYSAGMEDPVKRLAGRSADDFLAVKASWLVRDIRRSSAVGGGHERGPVRVLDFGCGTGALLRLLQAAAPELATCGCDASSGMLEQARRGDWREPRPDLRQCTGSLVPYAAEQFDTVVACCVFHHSRQAYRGAFLSDLVRVLRPGGSLYVFEHNPMNPVTAWMVKRTPIDQNAVLLTPKEVMGLARGAGLVTDGCRYLLFLPPRWRWCRTIDRFLSRWLPGGGQYVVKARKARACG